MVSRIESGSCLSGTPPPCDKTAVDDDDHQTGHVELDSHTSSSPGPTQPGHTLEKYEMSRLYTDGPTFTQWKVEQYSAWAEAAK